MNTNRKLSEDGNKMLKSALISYCYAQRSYTMLLHDFEISNKMYSSEDTSNAVAELRGEGYFEGNIACPHLTGEGIKAAKVGYVTYSDNIVESAKRERLFNRRMNWTILIVSILGLIVSVIAIFTK